MKSTFKKIIILILTIEARLILKKYRPKIVGVTGSVGKTSTKDAVYAVLAGSFYVRKSQKSYNTEFGVPLTIIGGRNGWSNPFIWLETIIRGLRLLLVPSRYPEWLVLEIGADRPGDIKFLTSWVKPDIAIFTRFGDVPVHVEFFKSKKALIEEKTYLAKSLTEKGILILNADDPEVVALKSYSRGHLVTYGVGDAQVAASNYTLYFERENPEAPELLTGFSFKANIRGNCLPIIRRGIVGEHHMYPVLAALAVASALELNLVSATESLGKEVLPPGRMRLIPGIKNSLIIDDTYNSSPVAVLEALTTFKSISEKAARAIVVLGDMLELGKFSVDEHKKVGTLVQSSTAGVLVTVGVRAKQIADGAREAGMKRTTIHEFENSVDAGRFLDSFVKEGDYVLVKGSQGIRTERIVEEIMAHPEERQNLLVRQDKEWQSR